MNAVEIEQAVSELAEQPFDAKNFPFAFLEAFGNKKTTMTTSQSGRTISPGTACLKYRDGGFKGSIAQLFAVEAIPQSFNIDADGILQDQHIGDASIEGKLKKLIARAHELQTAQKQP